MSRDSVIIYHNPRCGKSRLTLELLQKHGFEPKIVDYLKTPPSAAELSDILEKLGLEPRALMRKAEPPYRAEGLDDPKLSRAKLIAAMVKHPILIERPIVVRGKQAALGRPPEAVLKIL